MKLERTVIETRRCFAEFDGIFLTFRVESSTQGDPILSGKCIKRSTKIDTSEVFWWNSKNPRYDVLEEKIAKQVGVPADFVREALIKAKEAQP
jgi:hypothetical protein